MADLITTAELSNRLERRLNAAKNFAQILTDVLETRFGQSDDPSDDSLLFLAYQANEAARLADEEFHAVLNMAAAKRLAIAA